MLICGEGRLNAFKSLGETTIPSMVVDVSDEDAFIMSLAERAVPTLRRFVASRSAHDHLDAELFEKTLQLLKGLPELGVLLQVERELPSLIRQVFGEHGALFKKADMDQWQKAESRLREALVEFAHAAKSTYQGRLFSQDALQGLSRCHYSVTQQVEQSRLHSKQLIR